MTQPFPLLGIDSGEMEMCPHKSLYKKACNFIHSREIVIGSMLDNQKTDKLWCIHMMENSSGKKGKVS